MRDLDGYEDGYSDAEMIRENQELRKENKAIHEQLAESVDEIIALKAQIGEYERSYAELLDKHLNLLNLANPKLL